MALSLSESFSLARFGLSETQIADALLNAFVDAAGEARRTEGVRAIRDAVAAWKNGCSTGRRAGNHVDGDWPIEQGRDWCAPGR